MNTNFRFKAALPFIIFHISALAVFFTGINLKSILICIGLYLLRIWAVTGGYHRYFSHKSFSTGRVFQFILAFLAQSSAQQGVLWWANHHRKHHLYSDQPEDAHSPRQSGFWHSHVGWIFTDEYLDRNYARVKDWQKFPELVWLDKHQYLPATILGIIVFLCAGWTGLVVGFVWSTLLVYHCTFFINSLSHVYGKQRYHTGDDSRNNWWLALITLGEGWHNNHHHYPVATRQGFHWWEIDITYYVLKALEKCGVVWDLKAPPATVVCNTETMSTTVRARSQQLLLPIKTGLETVQKHMNDLGQRINKLSEIPQAQWREVCHDLENYSQRIKQSLVEKRAQLKSLPPKLAQQIRPAVEKGIARLDEIIQALEAPQRLLLLKALPHMNLDLQCCEV